MAIIAEHLTLVCTRAAVRELYETMGDVYIHHVDGKIFLNGTDSPDSIACLRKYNVFQSHFTGFTEEQRENGEDLQDLAQTQDEWCDAMTGVDTNIRYGIKNAGHTLEDAENGDLWDSSYDHDWMHEQELASSWDLDDYTLKTKTATMMALDPNQSMWPVPMAGREI